MEISGASFYFKSEGGGRLKALPNVVVEADISGICLLNRHMRIKGMGYRSCARSWH